MADAIDCVDAAYDLWRIAFAEYSDGDFDDRVELCSFISFHDDRLLNDDILDRNDEFRLLSTSLSSDASEFISESMR